MPLQLLSNASAEYILNQEREIPDPTVFVIKSLTVAERIDLGSLFKGATEETIGTMLANDFSVLMRMCEAGVQEIRGPGIPSDQPPIQILNRVQDVTIIPELVGAIFQHNFMNQDEEKNSGGLRVPAQPGRSVATAPITARNERRVAKKRQ